VPDMGDGARVVSDIRRGDRHEGWCLNSIRQGLESGARHRDWYQMCHIYMR